MKEKPISLGNIYEYWGTIRERKKYTNIPDEYEMTKKSILDHVKENGEIILDIPPYQEELLTYSEFESRFDEIVDKVETLIDAENER